MSALSLAEPASPWPAKHERKRDRAVKREAVLHAAVQAFNRKGFHATSLDEVAASLNVTKPTIYHYFANKDEILFECVRLGLDGIRVAAETVERNGGSGFDRLKALMRRYAIIMTQDFGICVTRTADHELSPPAKTQFRALKREIDHTVRRVVADGMRDGSLAAGDPKIVTFTLTGALNWIARWYDPAGSLSAEEVADGCVATLLLGLTPRSGA
ncbi:MAG: TetR family transcriptional regulator [Alphaproteobacteria bacterium]|nr:TetR family transcriptional regulator [Alphaproteobacteria bacterium]